MTALHVALLLVGALCLVAAMYVWMIRSNRKYHRQMERRRHAWDTGIQESVIGGQERSLCSDGHG